MSLASFSLHAAQQKQTNILSDCTIAFSGMTSQKDTWEWDLYMYRFSKNGPCVVGKVYFSLGHNDKGERVGEIRQLAVDAKYRGHGYGSAFFMMGCDLLRALGVTQITLQMLPESGYEEKLETFYKKLGCVVDKPGCMHVDLKRCAESPFLPRDVAEFLRKYKNYHKHLSVSFSPTDIVSPNQALLQSYVQYYLDRYSALHSSATMTKSNLLAQPSAVTQNACRGERRSCCLLATVVGLFTVGCSVAAGTLYQLLHK